MKYIIFDIDGTLTDTKKVEDKCFMSAFEQTFGISIWNQKWEQLENVTDWGITEEIIQREMGRKPKAEEYDHMISSFVALLNKEYQKDKTQFLEIDGSRDFFYRLKEMEKYHLGIATGSWSRSATLKLNAIGIDPNGVSFSNSDHHQSREAITQDVIQQMHRKSGTKPEEVIYFGDGEWDFKTCQNLGIRFIGIDNLESGKLEGLGADTVFKDFSKPHRILGEM